jgi:hypothetical protein
MLTYADRSSDFKFQEFARLTQEADSLQTRADALLSRADTIDGLIQSTQNDLGEKRKEFEHYKNRAQVITASYKCRNVVIETYSTLQQTIFCIYWGTCVAGCGHMCRLFVALQN